MKALSGDLPEFMGTLTVGGLREAMRADGFATFACPDEGAVVDIAQQYGTVMMHRDSDDRGVTPIRETPGRDPARDIGLTTAELLPHTDRPAIAEPPRVLLLWCQDAGAEGGEAVVVRASDVVRHLGERDAGALRALCDPEAVIFRTGGDQFVSPVFKVEDGIVTEVRLRFDPFVHFSCAAARALPSLESALSDVALTFTLRPGTGYALRNDIWLHGRAAYAGPREMSRVMIAS
ncbi:TauD/TfdA family dioxygenase [Kitasatospora sp. NBC_01266]|uniref:TauD/TfdA family dioxygenase n=1 Tax=Kitasatospora sp. NBC_01266 TaxID=2903572 RepID=UPI002E34C0D4|nr:TauD/TfdA family dioxygenase [Kitasatospora sp. NBC_01266]